MCVTFGNPSEPCCEGVARCKKCSSIDWAQNTWRFEQPRAAAAIVYDATQSIIYEEITAAQNIRMRKRDPASNPYDEGRQCAWDIDFIPWQAAYRSLITRSDGDINDQSLLVNPEHIGDDTTDYLSADAYDFGALRNERFGNRYEWVFRWQTYYQVTSPGPDPGPQPIDFIVARYRTPDHFDCEGANVFTLDEDYLTEQGFTLPQLLPAWIRVTRVRGVLEDA